MKKKTVNKEIFGKRLSELMMRNNETTYTVAEEFSLTSPTISRYVTGQMAAKITTIEQMANYFNVNPVWLMGYDVPMERDDPSDEMEFSNFLSEEMVSLINDPSLQSVFEALKNSELKPQLITYANFLLSERKEKGV